MACNQLVKSDAQQAGPLTKALCDQVALPIAWPAGVVSKRYNDEITILLNRDNRERESVKEKALGVKVRGFPCQGRQRREVLAKEINRVFECVDQASPETGALTRTTRIRRS